MTLSGEPVTVGWLAEHCDLPPADVLDQLIAAGADCFLWEGASYDGDGARRLRREFMPWDATPELVVTLNEEQWRALDDE